MPPATLAEPGKPLPLPEVRVLIDISGSMKRTDPRNLRAPALRLLVGLLPQEARDTDGVYERTDDAAELQRIFLRLFEKSAPRDALPLKDNAFTVDATVAQLTLLVFRQPEAAPTRILTPDGGGRRGPGGQTARLALGAGGRARSHHHRPARAGAVAHPGRPRSRQPRPDPLRSAPEQPAAA